MLIEISAVAEQIEPDRKPSWKESILTWLVLSAALWLLLILGLRAI